MATNASYEKKLRVASASTGPWSEVKSDDPAVNITADMLETTSVGGAGDKTRIVGLKDWNISCSLFNDAADPAQVLILAAFTGRSDLYIQYHPTKDTTTGWEGKGRVESFNYAGGVADVEKISVSIQANGPLTAI